MPTKPTATFTHATNLNFTLGPAVGFPTKLPVPDVPNGFVPGTGVSAEQVNQQFNIIGDWLTNWLIFGSPLPTLDAHIVETDVDGFTAVAGATLGGTASPTPNFALEVSENAGTPFVSAVFTNTAAGTPLVSLANTGVGVGLGAVVGSNTGSGPGVVGVSTSGVGGDFSGGGTSPGVVATGGPTDGTGASVTGQGAGSGLLAQAGPTGAGVTVFGDPASPKPAGEFFGNVFAGPQVRGTLYMRPTPPVPSGPLDGDFWKRSAFGPGAGRGGLEWWDGDGAPEGGAPGKQRAWSTTNGLGFQYVEVEPDQTTGNTVLQTAATLQVGANVSPGDPEGFWIVEWYAEIRLSGPLVPLTTRAVVAAYDGGVEIARAEYDFAALGQPKVFSGFRRRSYSGVVKTFEIKFASVTLGEDVIIRRARIVARGAFEDNSI